jgi:two-component system, NarL family, sensor kinase
MYKPYFYIIIFLLSFEAMAQKDTISIQKLMDQAYFLEQNQPEKALQLYQKTHQLSLKTNYKDGAYKSLLYSGIVYSDNGKYDSAIHYYNKTIRYCSEEKISIGIAKGYANMANAYQFKGDYSKAAKYYLGSIKLFEKTNDSAIISQSYQNLSALYDNINNQKLELLYLKKAIQYSDKTKKEQLGLLYGDVGLTLLNQNKTKEAFVYFKKTEDLSKMDKSERLLFFTKRNLGEYYKNTKNYLKAISYYEDALVLSESQKDAFQKADLYNTLSELYLEIKNFNKSLHYGFLTLELAKEINAKEFLFRSQKRISTIYNQLGQYQKGYDYLLISSDIKDTLLNENHIKQMSLLQTQFETEKKDKSIIEQQVKLKKQELDLIKSQKEKEMYFVFSLVLILLSFGIWYFFRQRQKINDKEIITLHQQQEITKLEALIDGEEKERRRIAQELHDGLNGDLSAIKYRLSTLEDSGLSKIDTENLNKVIDMIDESCAQVRSISHNLMPASIVDYGLLETIREFCSKMNASQTVKIDFQSFGNPIELSQKTETVIYRIIQELVTNILKHSKANEALIQFNYREDELFITVEDNGIGFDKNAISPGIGHKNIKTRIDFLNAQLDVESSSAGTSYTISIDLNNVK